MPTINPMAVYTTENGEEESDDFSGDAPLAARFEARADGTAGYEAAYEWRFTLEGEAEPYLVRHEENTGYTFTRAGTHLIEPLRHIRQPWRHHRLYRRLLGGARPTARHREREPPGDAQRLLAKRRRPERRVPREERIQVDCGVSRRNFQPMGA